MKKYIPTQLRTKPFSVQEALAHGLNKACLMRMLKAGLLERISRGIYQTRNNEENGESLYRVATLRCGMPSAIARAKQDVGFEVL